MRGFTKLAAADLRLYVREPIATFFTIVFPPLIVVLNGTIFGNTPSETFGGLGPMDVAMPGYVAMVLGIVGFMSIPITLATYRETGVLRRLRSTPLKPMTYISADVVSNLLMGLAGVSVLLIAGVAIYQVVFEGSAPIVALAILLCALSMFSIGYLIAALAPTARSANIVGLAILYPMMFLSGATIPLQVMPQTVQNIAKFLPLTYAVRLLRGLWFGEPWSEYLFATAVLLGVLMVCTALAARFFRWE